MSREIDSEIAKALGWRVHNEYKLTDGKRIWDTPWYSTSIEAAWQVVEWMREKGWEFYLSWEPSDNGQVWGVAFMFYGDGPKEYRHHYKEAPTAPEAICRTFLATQGNELNGQDETTSTDL